MKVERQKISLGEEAVGNTVYLNDVAVKQYTSTI